MNRKSFVVEYNAAQRGGVNKFLLSTFHDLFKFRYAIYNFISSNLRARYRRSAIGFFWSLLNPLFTMVVMSIVFSAIFKSSLANFSIYIFSGLLPWSMILYGVINGTNSLVMSERYLKKVYVPKILFPIVIVSVEVVNFVFSLVSLFFLALFLGAKTSWALLAIPIALLLTSFFLLGLVMIVSMVNAYFRDLFHIIQVVLTGLFYMTPIVYPLDFVSSESLLYIILRLNPVMYFVELFHAIIYRAEFPGLLSWLICLGLAIISMLLGILVFSHREKDVIYRL